MTGDDFLHVLRLLGDPDVTAQQRADAENLVRDRLRWMRSWLRKNFTLLIDPDDIDDVLDHVVDAAAAATTPLRGEYGNRTAINWVKTVARNRALDLLRRRASLERKRGLLLQEDERRRLAEEQERTDVEICKLVIALVERHVANSSHAHGANKLKRMRLGLEAVWTKATTRDQLVAGGYLDEGQRDPSVFKRARSLLYQHRRRGRIELARVVYALVLAGQIDDDDAERFAALNRLNPWPPAGDEEDSDGEDSED